MRIISLYTYRKKKKGKKKKIKILNSVGHVMRDVTYMYRLLDGFQVNFRLRRV